MGVVFSKSAPKVLGIYQRVGKDDCWVSLVGLNQAKLADRDIDANKAWSARSYRFENDRSKEVKRFWKVEYYYTDQSMVSNEGSTFSRM